MKNKHRYKYKELQEVLKLRRIILRSAYIANTIPLTTFKRYVRLRFKYRTYDSIYAKNRALEQFLGALSHEVKRAGIQIHFYRCNSLKDSINSIHFVEIPNIENIPFTVDEQKKFKYIKRRLQ